MKVVGNKIANNCMFFNYSCKNNQYYNFFKIGSLSCLKISKNLPKILANKKELNFVK